MAGSSFIGRETGTVCGTDRGPSLVGPGPPVCVLLSAVEQMVVIELFTQYSSIQLNTDNCSRVHLNTAECVIVQLGAAECNLM